MLLATALQELRVDFVCSDARGSADVPAGSFAGAVTDAYLDTPIRALVCFVQVARIVWRSRPKVVISTGAAPGLFAVAVGSMLGAKTIWVESLCGITRLTTSGRLARMFVTKFLVQWPELASGDAEYYGNLL
jgi:UDP-N-acetylglucosamine:LPS N-acetylglucosamine transferase